MMKYVVVKIILSKQIYFNIIGIYRPTAADSDILKDCNLSIILLLMHDLNVHWEEKYEGKKKFKEKYHLEQLDEGSTTIVRSSSYTN